MKNEAAPIGRIERYVSECPCLILLMGVAGTGKTTLARELIRRVNAIYLDNNHIADAFFPETRNSEDYLASRPGFYRVLYAIAEANLMLGNAVLLDAPHVKEIQLAQWRRDIEDLVARANAELIVIRCICSEQVLKTRLQERGEPRDRWKLEHWKDFLRKEPIEVPVLFDHLDVNTEHSLQHNTDAAARYIQRRCENRS
jgi:predicted kinase